ncbi:MAG: cbb3-type cytochrome oxidase assembly protein CcoS [Bacteroidetes bacterium CG18_big_fil_WC_8_21_14_2_50_41_14]|nr:MAG: cbb3-type cytochrome oxidase assembly protein CcoS [Bacteroidetes bacterium CG18_big_fil_WC_8_21_14_2_50_41_14]PJB56676.1 MAG: cbb3-type cytochrome oxidase assembly protein CcoS [Bacteroidetes bacterium CG_4_9_14_3_um_filter_41_19]
MTVIILLAVIGIIVAGGFLLGFIWAVRNGQYDDMYSPSVRILFDESKKKDSASVVTSDEEKTEENKIDQNHFLTN